MLELLHQRPRSVTELAQPFHLRISTITQHVRALRVAGLITDRQRGAAHEYSLVRDRLRPIEQWMRGFAKSSVALTAR
jgi:DNA-binding transcriptional ArsR family regulator